MSGRTLGSTVLAGLLVISCLVGLGSGRGIAQQPPSQETGQKRVTFAVQDEDVRDALRKLFKTVEAPYSIAVDVQGTVTVNFRDASFHDALTSMLKQVNATYMVEAGVYQVVVKPRVSIGEHDPRDFKMTVPGVAREPATITQDDRFLYVLRGDELYKVNKSDLKTVARGRLGQ